MPWQISPGGVAWACMVALFASMAIRCVQLQWQLDACTSALDFHQNRVGSSSSSVVDDIASSVETSSAAGIAAGAGQASGRSLGVAASLRAEGYRTRLFVHMPSATAGRTHTPDMSNVTLVTHVTLDRAPRLARLCASWRGPMSVSVFRRPIDTRDAVPSVAAAVAATDECIARHAVLHEVEMDEGIGGVDMFTHYPFNVQRNAALSGAVGDWVFLLDVDFEIHPNDRARERVFSKQFHALRVTHKSIFAGPAGTDPDLAIAIVPAVETVTPNVSSPTTFESLRAALQAREVCAFYGHYCKNCHRPTNVERYAAQSSKMAGNGNTPYAVQYRDGFEPYVVAKRSTLPRYDERFIGRGWDKMSFFYELNAMRRPFVVLPPPMPFLVHAGRGDMPTNYTKEFMDRQRQNSMLMQNFKLAVAKKYNNNGGTTNDEAGSGDAKQQQQPHKKKPTVVDVASVRRVSPEEQQAALEEALAKRPSTTVPKWTKDSSLLLNNNQEQQDDAADVGGPAGAFNPDDYAPTAPELRGDQVVDWTTVSATLGGAKACVAQWRGEELDNVTTPRLEAALSYACNHIDCRPLHLGGIRHQPARLAAHADWAFDRYMHWAIHERGEDPRRACHFGGAARLVDCAQQCFGCRTVPEANDERIGRALEWVCGPDALKDCGMILAGLGGNPNRTVAEKASVLFTYHYLANRCTHGHVDEACFFGGAAERVPCNAVPD